MGVLSKFWLYSDRRTDLLLNGRKPELSGPLEQPGMCLICLRLHGSGFLAMVANPTQAIMRRNELEQLAHPPHCPKATGNPPL
jgi:hypothetical protein